MSKLFYLIVLILCAFLAHEILGSSDEDNAALSLNPHKRQKQMNHDQIPIRPSDMPGLSPIGLVDIKEPSRVTIFHDNYARIGYAINPYFIITRPGFVKGLFHVGAAVAAESEEFYEYKTYRNLALNVALVRVDSPMYLQRPELHALERVGYSQAAIIWAVEIVKKWANKKGYMFFMIGSISDAGSPVLASRSG